ncbi:hypothetical protein MUK42_04672 [Musa troglodytarum]|uniref:Uncharacterized protein n=1 Tax=Musa troglodytarum TaxID=320322 RepID=A0A9E7KAQ5_9LILI|nr:hypothetical protein MUK42_04672 [Musa troglodytarum]
MGNCIDLQKPVTWVDDGDDWGAFEHKSSGRQAKQQDEAKLFLAPAAEEEGDAGSTEFKIKIKISKKRLEALLRRAQGQEPPLQQLLADLRSMAESWERHDRETHWRPSLQSIPEAPE